MCDYSQWVLDDGIAIGVNGIIETMRTMGMPEEQIDLILRKYSETHKSSSDLNAHTTAQA